MTTETDPLLTIEEAADRLRTPVATVRYWRAQGRGPAFFRMGRRIVCRESEIERFVAELQAAETATATA